MTESDSLFVDFYDCNSSSNSFLKFEASSPLFELSPQSSGRLSPPTPLASNSNSNDKMDSTQNNPLLTTASMPIPTRNVSSNSTLNNNNSRIDFSEVIFDFENSRSPLSAISENPRHDQLPMLINYTENNILGLQQNDAYNTGVTWDSVNPMMNITMNSSVTSGVDLNEKPFRMDEDDIFQVDKSDLIQGPTLAELNGGDGNLYVDLLNIEELIANDSSHYMQPSSMQNLAQLSSVNFQNLQNAIEASQVEQLSPNQYQTIAIPQTPHNTPIPSFQSTGGKLIFCDDANSFFSPTNQLTVSTNVQNITNTTSQLAAFSPESHSSTSTSSIALNSSLSPPPSHSTFTPTRVRQPRGSRANNGSVQYNPKYSTLHSLLMKKDPSNAEKDLMKKIQQSATSSQASSSSAVPPRRLQMQGGSFVSRLSSSAPTQGFEHIWQRREPRPHLLSTGSLAEGQGSTSSLSGEVLSPENIDFSQDDYSDEDSDHYEDYSSDSDNEDSKHHLRGLMNNDSNNNKPYSGSKKSRFFWQYNVQAKGPKGQRLIIKTQAEDPHNLNEATDPVFSPSCSVRGIKSVQIKHSGKARKGDGNDLTPNAKKLTAIGKELDKLGKVINEITPVSELPFNVRPKTRKEKNKLASRACRLKKKAQHEANKIKLYGLEHEHKNLINGIKHMKHLIAMKCSQSQENRSEINERVDQVLADATRVRIADNSTDYVNRVLDRMKSGVPGGGLDEF